jgi:hypothetical protein
MASPPSVAMDGGARLNLWTTGLYISVASEWPQLLVHA